MSVAHDLLNMARDFGYTLTVNGDMLKVRPVPPPDLLEELRAHKAELLALLTDPANDTHHDTVTDLQSAFLRRGVERGGRAQRLAHPQNLVFSGGRVCGLPGLL